MTVQRPSTARRGTRPGVVEVPGARSFASVMGRALSQLLPHIVHRRAEAKRNGPRQRPGAVSWGDLGTNPMFPWLSLRRGADRPEARPGGGTASGGRLVSVSGDGPPIPFASGSGTPPTRGEGLSDLRMCRSCRTSGWGPGGSGPFFRDRSPLVGERTGRRPVVGGEPREKVNTSRSFRVIPLIPFAFGSGTSPTRREGLRAAGHMRNTCHPSRGGGAARRGSRPGGAAGLGGLPSASDCSSPSGGGGAGRRSVTEGVQWRPRL